MLGRVVRLDGRPTEIIGVLPPNFSGVPRSAPQTSLRFFSWGPEDRSNRDDHYLVVVGRLAPGERVGGPCRGEGHRRSTRFRLSEFERQSRRRGHAVARPPHETRSSGSPGTRRRRGLRAPGGPCERGEPPSRPPHRPPDRARGSPSAWRPRFEPAWPASRRGRAHHGLRGRSWPRPGNRCGPYGDAVPPQKHYRRQRHRRGVAHHPRRRRRLPPDLVGSLRGSDGENDASTALREGNRSVVGTRRRLQDSLVVAEVALSLCLLVAAGLTSRTLASLLSLRLGFEPDRALSIETVISNPAYRPLDERVAFYRRILDRVRAIPGVEAAGYTSHLPLECSCDNNTVVLEGQPIPPPGHENIVSVRVVTPGYFTALGSPILRGRELTDGDTSLSEQVALVNESFAARYFPGHDAVGRSVQRGAGTGASAVDQGRGCCTRPASIGSHGGREARDLLAPGSIPRVLFPPQEPGCPRVP